MLLLSLFCLLTQNCVAGSYEDGENSVAIKHGYRKTYKNEFAVKIIGGNSEDATALALKHGMINHGPIIHGEEYFLFENPRLKNRARRKSRSVNTASLSKESNVIWVQQQIAKVRVKRTSFNMEPVNSRVRIHVNKGMNHSFDFNKMEPNDPLWQDMWYLRRSDDNVKLPDHNVKEAWALGYTGKGVVVTILDDGLERTHPDLQPNYDPLASFDVNDRDDDPMPRYDYSNENRHGTRCAGEVSAVFNNSLCITGVSYNAKIGGIRMLDGEVTDAVEAAALSFNPQHIDIFSSSWGPSDLSDVFDGPAKLTREAFEKGVKYGRGGLGSIFVWASGNGGKEDDVCSADGYTNSIYTLSISSATESGNIPWYSEACSSTLATTYSSGSNDEKMILTTDLHGSYTRSHTGTSASAPIAAGISALALEANPKLSWRDLQHIIIQTSKSKGLISNDWKTNGVNRTVSHSFGYGLLDAGAIVKRASKWQSVPVQRKCKITYPARYKVIPNGKRIVLQQHTNVCSNSNDHIKYVEHVQAVISLTAPKRGDIQIFLTSPKGTRSDLLRKRSRDRSRAGFKDWAFMSVHTWGEDPQGIWTLEIENDGWDDSELIRWDLVFYGTEEEITENGWEGRKTQPNHVSLRSTNLPTFSHTNGAHKLYKIPCLLIFISIVTIIVQIF